MKAGFGALCALFLAGCGGPIAVGGDPSPAGTPEAAYRSAYDRFLGWHRRMIQSLFAMNPPNFPGAQEAAAYAAAKLASMQELLESPERKEALAQVIEKYRRAEGNFSRSRSAGSQPQLDQWEYVVRRDFVFGQVKIAGPLPTPPPQPAPPPSDGTPAWIYFKAWEQSHAELVRAWSDGADCAAPYERVLEALRRLGQARPDVDAAKAATLIDSYRATFKATGGLREPPAGADRQAVLDDLAAVASAVRLHLESRPK